MKKWDLIELRDPAELRIRHGYQVSTFEVEVLDINEDSICINMPVVDPRFIELQIGLRVEIDYRKGEYIYRFRSKMIGERRVASTTAMVIAPPLEISRVRQSLKRNFLRINFHAPILYRRKDRSISKGYRKGVITNISAGGICFHIHRSDSSDIKGGTPLLISFDLSERIKIIEQECVVLKKKRSRSFLGESDIICKFVNMPDKKSEAITLHNIHYQRRLRREGRDEETKWQSGD